MAVFSFAAVFPVAFFLGRPPDLPPLGLAKPMVFNALLRWTMPMMELRETGLPRSAVKRTAIPVADRPSLSQTAISCNSVSV
ncbi:hypothetical protein NKI15_09050 [Mesorhizobium sp. M0862]|uniref:hypothetical protein n=1 Tax=Mesorhizobium sp. M0862 TaxID=2957015 RepID=UPI000418F7E8